jgi:hypothetical protein
MPQQAERKSWPPKGSPIGLICPRCSCADLRVRNTRYSMGRIVRYRQCRHCGRRVTTYEVLPSKLADSSPQQAGK